MMNIKFCKKNIIKNLGLIATIGTATYFLFNNTRKSKQRKIKRNATRAIRSIGNAVNSFSSVIG